MGWAFQVDIPVRVVALQIHPHHTYAAHKLHLWRASDSALLASVQGAATADTWNTLALASPVDLAAGTTYIVSMNHPAGGDYYYVREPAAGEFNEHVTFVNGMGVTCQDTYPSVDIGPYAYGIVGFVMAGDGSLAWRNDSTSPPLANGARCGSTDSGSSWVEDTTRDYIFEEGDQK
jgi:hypothetical protein